MKKLLVVLFIGVFLFAVSGCSNPRNTAIGVAGGVIGGALLLTGYNTSQREETNRILGNREYDVQEKKINADVNVAALHSGVTNGTTEYGDAKDEAGNKVARLKITDLKREPVSVQSVSGSIREENLIAPAPQYRQQQPQRRGSCHGLPFREYNDCLRANGLM